MNQDFPVKSVWGLHRFILIWWPWKIRFLSLWNFTLGLFAERLLGYRIDILKAVSFYVQGRRHWLSCASLFFTDMFRIISFTLSRKFNCLLYRFLGWKTMFHRESTFLAMFVHFHQSGWLDSNQRPHAPQSLPFILYVFVFIWNSIYL